MALSASPQPIFTVGPVLSPITIQLDESAQEQRSWIRPSTAALPVRAAPWMSPEPRAAVEWRFGDLTLIRDARPIGQPPAGTPRGQRLRHRGCIALLCSEAEAGSPTLFVSSRAGPALAALEQSARRFGNAEERLALLVPETGWKARARRRPSRCVGSRLKPVQPRSWQASCGNSPASRGMSAKTRPEAWRSRCEPFWRPASLPPETLLRPKRHRRRRAPWNARARSSSVTWARLISARHSWAAFWRCRVPSSIACSTVTAASPISSTASGCCRRGAI